MVPQGTHDTDRAPNWQPGEYIQVVHSVGYPVYWLVSSEHPTIMSAV